MRVKLVDVLIISAACRFPAIFSRRILVLQLIFAVMLRGDEPEWLILMGFLF